MPTSFNCATTLAAAVLAMAAWTTPAQAVASQTVLVAIADVDRITFATASPPTTTDPYVRMLRRQNAPAQAWEQAPAKDGQGSTFVNQETRGCLMLDQFGPVNGYAVQRPCTGAAHEVWVPRQTGTNGVVMIVNAASGGCLTQPSPTSADPRLRVGPCDGVRQGFRLLPLA